MHLFRHVRKVTTAGELARALEQTLAGHDRLGLLLAAARLEGALADASGADDWAPDRLAWLVLSRQAAACYLGLASWPGAAVQAACQSLASYRQPLIISEPEGLRYYGLAPEGFAAAARRWQRDHPRQCAVWVLGLRTMGSVLAPVVAEALAATCAGSVRCLTLRPAGLPAARRIAATERLRREFARWPGAFLVVDEGPGLSGSSFAGTVDLLSGLGVRDDLIAVLPSWSPPPERLNSPIAADGWRRWRIYPADPLPPPQSAGGPASDLGGGAWRGVLRAPAATPVWGEHERRKYLADHACTLVKFAGLGPYGRSTAERARRLAQAGWGPPLAPEAESEPGWLRYRRLHAPLLPARPGRAWCEFAGRYLAWVRSEYALGRPTAPSAALQEMVVQNLERFMGLTPPWEPPTGVPVALDGCMLPVEWGLRNGSWVKFDGTDHGDDPFFPGPADIAWDLAALSVEFGHAHGAAAVAAYRRASGETVAALVPRLRWHGLAYCLFRAAYCGLAATRVDEPDTGWFQRDGARYLNACRRRLSAQR